MPAPSISSRGSRTFGCHLRPMFARHQSGLLHSWRFYQYPYSLDRAVSSGYCSRSPPDCRKCTPWRSSELKGKGCSVCTSLTTTVSTAAFCSLLSALLHAFVYLCAKKSQLSFLHRYQSDHSYLSKSLVFAHECESCCSSHGDDVYRERDQLVGADKGLFLVVMSG